MNVIEVNEGAKIPYTISKAKITFDDELTLNLAKLERDFDVHIDVCRDALGILCMGLGRAYVAQIDIPARQYTETEKDNPDYDEDDPMSQKTIVEKNPVPFQMANATLKLFSTEV